MVCWSSFQSRAVPAVQMALLLIAAAQTQAKLCTPQRFHCIPVHPLPRAPQVSPPLVNLPCARGSEASTALSHEEYLKQHHLSVYLKEIVRWVPSTCRHVCQYHRQSVSQATQARLATCSCLRRFIGLSCVAGCSVIMQRGDRNASAVDLLAAYFTTVCTGRHLKGQPYSFLSGENAQTPFISQEPQQIKRPLSD